jgi:hypothetical protein
MVLLLLAGCAEESVAGPHALGFDGSPDCAQAEVAGDPPAAFTVEAWVRGDPSAVETALPFVNLAGVFDLGQDDQGIVRFSVGSGEGTSYGVSLLDGVLHHVAGTFADGQATLFVDGEWVAFASAALDGSSSGTLRFGCRASGDGFAGLLDEVRLSSTIRYTDTFALTAAPFDLDDDTWLLFHFDEGTGDTTKDAVAGTEAILDGTEWVSFDLGGAAEEAN